MSCRDCRSRTRPCPATAKRSCLLLRIARHRRAVSVGLGLAAAWLGPYRDANAVTPTKQSEPLTSGARSALRDLDDVTSEAQGVVPRKRRGLDNCFKRLNG